MRKKILLVEDEFIVANDLRHLLQKAGYSVCGIADSVSEARKLIREEQPDLVLLDIILNGRQTGIDLASELNEAQIAFVYLSANSNQSILEAAKITQPYGFLVKPFRDKDILVALDIAWYRHEQTLKLSPKKNGPLPENTHSFEGIIGKSRSLLAVLQQIEQVAPADTSVLILGESGTGKEQICNCIHRLSPRKSGPLVKINCAALPSSLIESELFGHEKGAFTGAVDRRIGKFEQASGGTIVLDEIGEMPLEMQVKLLRVLQEKEIERIGGKAPIKVDVRIIAATNRNLEKEIAEGRFRLDLYYRLNVFPIVLPPLRERKEDIPLLAQHFLSHYGRKIGKNVTEISTKVWKNLEAYDWPGNIRELEHLIERSILLAQDEVIQEVFLQPAIQKNAAKPPEDSQVKTIHENEREHILAVLKKCNGRIWGHGGAADLLGVPPTTLNSKMKKLGIKRGEFE
ncbi:MAG: sigma-54-dependent Fis family transcriptional regulator [Saprospiraceae bacterium]|nr:sigma-54-dependent Fis family transcriptional regulator [Saprospiraceae bacterium]